ncbi:LicD family-domain-containing protein [Chytriomyces cf. hyalinus JEL632]|nr:LicD family-domain-containing protein [Chytriomyces cf. hyalinus JEL632]
MIRPHALHPVLICVFILVLATLQLLHTEISPTTLQYSHAINDAPIRYQADEVMEAIVTSTKDTGGSIQIPSTHFSLLQDHPFTSDMQLSALLDRKYFREAGSDQKRDFRYAQLTRSSSIMSAIKSHFKPDHDLVIVQASLVQILQAWSTFTMRNEIVWWISHGALLGWAWNGKLLPWDTDLDIQMSMQQLVELVAYNGTMLEGRFLIDVNPSLFVRGRQRNNVIDARVVDTETGYFMDITGLADLAGHEEGVTCKSPHRYSYQDISPLKETELEGVRVWRPNESMRVLNAEYGTKALTKTMYRPSIWGRVYEWDAKANAWL